MTSSKAARMMRISSGLKLGMMTSGVRCTSVPDLACAIHTQSREALRRRLGGLEVDHRLEFGRCLDGEVGRLLALENAST